MDVAHEASVMFWLVLVFAFGIQGCSERLRDIRVGLKDTWPTTNGSSAVAMDTICGTQDGPYTEARLVIECNGNAVGRYLVIEIHVARGALTLCEVEVFAVQSTTTVGPSAATTTIGPSAAATTVGLSAATTTVGLSAAMTTVGPSAATTTVGPSASTTTVGPSASTTTVGPSAATTTVGPFCSCDLLASLSMTRGTFCRH